MQSNKPILYSLFILLSLGFNVLAQSPLYPKDYFVFPLKPGEQNFLAGTLGELRTNHFHAGLDIKTFGQINWLIHACADGYVARIKISPYGYGRAIYVQHPSGHTTVYAHCESFRKDIEEYIIKKQYEKKSYSIDVTVPKNLLSCKKNNIIAYSGNTGSSMGPHLHFEIRDKNQTALNPLSFGFTEIKDKVKPSFYKISLTTLEVDSRVNNEFGTFFFSPKDKGGKKYTTPTININGTVGLAIKARDKLSGVNNPNAIAKIIVEQDGKEIFNYFNEEVIFSQRSYMNIHMDYCSYKNGKGKLHKCYVDDGNKLNRYKTGKSKGKIVINDTLNHTLTVKIWDFYNNYSQLKIPVKGKKPTRNKLILNENKEEKVFVDIYKNILKVACRNCAADTKLKIDSETHHSEKKADYFVNNASVFLWDMRTEFPRKLALGERSLDENFIYPIPSGKKFTWFTKNITTTFHENSLFDTLYLQMKTYNDTLEIGEVQIPLKQKISITFRTIKKYNTDKTAVYEISGRKPSYIGGVWNKNKCTFKTKSFGKYTLLQDTTPPSIKDIGRNRFRIKDDLSGIQSYNAYLNGKWVLLKYDYRISRVVLAPRKGTTLKGELKIVVIDNANNKNIYTRNL